jgi:uncharacterized protein YjiS (DUF1127 family)
MTMITSVSDSAAAVPIGRRFATYLGDCINHWLAAWIAHKEREVARKMLLNFNDRQLRDMGLRRSQIDGALNRPQQPD